MIEQDNLSSENPKPGSKMSEDWAYVMNHAISCGVTDTFIQPGIGAYVQKRAAEGRLPRKLKGIFEDHDHDAHGHGTSFKGNLKHWIIGEAAGDVGAIPVTVAIQRYFPGLMNALRTVLEPVTGWYFRKGAERNAKAWAREQGLAEDGIEAKEKGISLYEYEMSHLPQAAMWNMVSIPINLGIQRLSGNKANWKTLAAGKIFGLTVSNTLLIGGRMLTPATFQKIDKFNGEALIKPADKFFGLNSEEPNLSAKLGQNGTKSWTERSQTSSAEVAR